MSCRIISQQAASCDQCPTKKPQPKPGEQPSKDLPLFSGTLVQPVAATKKTLSPA